MNSNDKIFSNSDCISLNKIMDYIHDRLSFKERNKVERHLIDCQFCQEAIEGYSLMKDENSIVSISHKIKHDINYTKERFAWEKIAAVLATAFMIGGLGYYISIRLNIHNQNTLANGVVSKSADSLKSASSIMDSIVALENNNTLAEELKQESSSDGLLRSNESTKDRFNKKELEEKQLEKSINSEGQRITPVASDMVPSEEEKSVLSPAVSPGVLSGPVNESKKEDDVKTAAVLNEVKVTDPLNENNSIVPRSTKSKAVSKKMASVDKDVMASKDEIVNYLEAGKQLYETKKYNEAVKYLEKVDQQSNDYEESLWYIGLSYLQLKETAKAKSAFEKVVKLDGKYKEKAKDELNNIK